VSDEVKTSRPRSRECLRERRGWVIDFIPAETQRHDAGIRAGFDHPIQRRVRRGRTGNRVAHAVDDPAQLNVMRFSDPGSGFVDRPELVVKRDALAPLVWLGVEVNLGIADVLSRQLGPVFRDEQCEVTGGADAVGARRKRFDEVGKS
jgi:hypothetical protein